MFVGSISSIAMNHDKKAYSKPQFFHIFPKKSLVPSKSLGQALGSLGRLRVAQVTAPENQSRKPFVVFQFEVGIPWRSPENPGGFKWFYHLVMTLPVCHGKIHHAIKNGTPSISMGHLYHGYVSHNQMVNGFKWFFPHLELDVNGGFEMRGFPSPCLSTRG